jgi:antitoxin FitA
MGQLMIPELDATLLQRLNARASAHGRTAEAEARIILQQALHWASGGSWAQVNVLRQTLATSGRHFSDAADLVREDRER